MEGFTQQQVGQYTIIEFYDSSLMDPSALDDLGKKLYRLIDAEDRRCIVLDFARVQYISSQFIGILLAMQKKLSALPRSSLQLCSVNPRLVELLRITKLDRVLHVRSSQQEAVQEQSLK